MNGPKFSFTAKVWQYPGHAAWHFVTLPTDIAADIRELVGTSPRGFGSIRVKVLVGKTSWKTSIFPDAKSKSYFLPIKKEVRTAENIIDENSVKLTIELTDLLT